MSLREKTNQKFKDYFEKVAKMYNGQEFELAFSEIQRETGAANITMKRAIETLVAEGWLDIKPGRNSRYGRFSIPTLCVQTPTPVPDESKEPEHPATTQQEEITGNHQSKLISELEYVVEGLRRRIRTQEMTIALLQDRVAEIEDKLYKR